MHREIRLILLWCLPRNQNASRKPRPCTLVTLKTSYSLGGQALLVNRTGASSRPWPPCLTAFFSGVALPLPALPPVSRTQLSWAFSICRKKVFLSLFSGLLTRSRALPYPQIHASFSLQNVCLIYRIENTQHFLKRKVCLRNHFKRFF